MITDDQGRCWRWRRGKLVMIPVEWVGQTVHDKTKRHRQSKLTAKQRKKNKYRRFVGKSSGKDNPQHARCNMGKEWDELVAEEAKAGTPVLVRENVLWPCPECGGEADQHTAICAARHCGRRTSGPPLPAPQPTVERRIAEMERELPDSKRFLALATEQIKRNEQDFVALEHSHVHQTVGVDPMQLSQMQETHKSDLEVIDQLRMMVKNREESLNAADELLREASVESDADCVDGCLVKVAGRLGVLLQELADYRQAAEVEARLKNEALAAWDRGAELLAELRDEDAYCDKTDLDVDAFLADHRTRRGAR